MLIKLEIYKDKIEKNLEKIKNINKNIICVLKDDAYGLGIENIFPILVENNCENFAVAYIEEAIKIRKLSRKYKEKKINIMTLNYIETENIKEIIENDIEITIFNFYQWEKYLKEFLKMNKKIKIHLKFNTGMNRLGFDEEEIEKIYIKIKEMEENSINFEIVSIFSHISDSENFKKIEKQINKYENILKKLNNFGIKYKYKHIQASPLLFKCGSKYNYDFARIGMAIYGMEPLNEKVGLEQTIKLSSKIINIKKVLKGEQISYGNNGILNENKIVAIVPVGYAHGFQKQIEKSEAFVLINGEKANILGEICMDMIIVDISKIENVNIDDEVLIIGKQKNNEITLLQMSKWANTIQDDILTKWNKSIKRIVK